MNFTINYSAEEIQLMDDLGVSEEVYTRLPLNQMFGRWTQTSAVNKSAGLSYGNQAKSSGPIGWTIFRKAQFLSEDADGALHLKRYNSNYLIRFDESTRMFMMNSFSSVMYERGINIYELSHEEATALATRTTEIEYVEEDPATIDQVVSILPIVKVENGTLDWSETLINGKPIEAKTVDMQMLLYNGESRKDLIGALNWQSHEVDNEVMQGWTVQEGESPTLDDATNTITFNPEPKYAFVRLRFKIGYRKWVTVNTNL